MSDEENKDFIDPYAPNPLEMRRNRAVSEQKEDTITYASNSISDDRIEALREFLKSASTDDIEMIRRCYGDLPEVLKLLGLER